MLLMVNLDTPSHRNKPLVKIDQQLPTVPLAKGSRPDGVKHRLTPAQRREIGRLYSESGMSVAALRKRFNVSEPSVYRILQTQGIALRGRGAAPAGSTNGTTQFRIEYL